MTEDAWQIIGVAAVVHDGDGRILLIRTAKAGWELPGGRVEQGEDLIAALKREVREETCCEIEVGRLTSVTTYVTRGATMFTFLGRPRLAILILLMTPSMRAGLPLKSPLNLSPIRQNTCG